MKISKQTLDLIKAFNNINTNLLIKPGSTLSTISAAKDIYAEVEVDEVFDVEAGIFNLGEFLGVISLYNDPEIDMENKYMTISEGKDKVKFVYADASVLTVPSKQFTMPPADITFQLTAVQLSKIQKASAALGVEDICFKGDGKKVVAIVNDCKNPTSNNFTVDLDTKTSDTFEIYFKVEKLKLIAGTYDVELSSKKISKFKHTTIPLTIYVALESNSTFV
jgi:hypothetical protein